MRIRGNASDTAGGRPGQRYNGKRSGERNTWAKTAAGKPGEEGVGGGLLLYRSPGGIHFLDSLGQIWATLAHIELVQELPRAAAGAQRILYSLPLEAIPEFSLSLGVV